MHRSIFCAAAGVLLAVASPSAAHDSCLITFRVGTSTELGTLTVFANYQAADGEFEGTATAVECEALNSTIVSVGDVDAARTLSMAAVGIPDAIAGPKDFLRCTWIPNENAPQAKDFDLSEQSATALSNGLPVDPDVTISDIECGGHGTTTTTTLPLIACGDFDGSGSIQVSDALGVLRTSVGAAQCLSCVCDLDGNGSKSVTDALLALRIAVGLSVTTNCPDC